MWPRTRRSSNVIFLNVHTPHPRATGQKWDSELLPQPSKAESHFKEEKEFDLL